MWPFKPTAKPAFKIGPFRPSPSAPPLTAGERETIDRFHDLYYRRWAQGGQTISVSWLGYETLKCPLDLWIYQELIVSQRPDFIVETGTRFGGSALFMASICEQIGHGRVITIDIDDSLKAIRPAHDRIVYLDGSSVDPSIRSRVDEFVAGGTCLVILDSDHSCDHVLSELRSFSPLINIGGYLIVEDTNVNGHPTLPNFGPGPMEALEIFLSENPLFQSDTKIERFLITLNPNGYLKRV